MAKYRLVAYFLHLTLGLFGVHHFYLGRDHQGILWVTSFGGLFGLGWIRDLWRIPWYVKEYNEDPEFLFKMTSGLRQRKRPSIWANIHRVVAQVGFGWFYRGLIIYALPEEYAANPYVMFLVAPLGTAFGTYMISNVSTIKTHWKYPLIGAYLGELAFGYHHFLLEVPHPSLAVSISMVFSTFAWQYDRQPRGLNVVHGERARGRHCRGRWCCRRLCCKRMAVWTIIILIFGALIFSFFYFNATITTSNGETVKVREAMNNFFKTPHWKQFKKSFWSNLQEIWEEYQRNGLAGAKERLMVLADFQGERRSRYVLQVGLNATMDELKEHYHALVKEWHPDRHRGAGAQEKMEAQEKFIEIQEAYEILKKLYKHREYRGGGTKH